MTWDLWTFVFGMIGAVATLAPLIVYLARRIRAVSVFSDPRLQTFLDDWVGRPARPGFPAQPGIPERLAKVETDTAQLQRNGGSTVADAIARMETRLLTELRPPGGSP